MDISIFASDNEKMLLKEPKGYEWWYMDFIDAKSGLSGVIIFYNGNLFSPAYIKTQSANQTEAVPDNFPAISLSLYQNGKPLYYSFLEHSATNAIYRETADGFRYQVGADWLAWRSRERQLSVHIDQHLASGTQLKADLIFSAWHEDVQVAKPSTTTAAHQWKCLQPVSEVQGLFHLDHEEFFVDAFGYHDHNAGTEPLHHFFRDWYWGRVYFPKSEKSLIYYAYATKTQFYPYLWEIDATAGVKSLEGLKATNFKRSLFGLKRALDFEQSFYKIAHLTTVDKGPFYERYLNTFTDVTTGEESVGFAEYIAPKRIYAPWVAPLVNLRLRYMYKSPHAVLRSKRMYPWTWKLL
jgi:carotenoid 1,2-hydratase